MAGSLFYARDVSAIRRPIQVRSSRRTPISFCAQRQEFALRTAQGRDCIDCKLTFCPADESYLPAIGRPSWFVISGWIVCQPQRFFRPDQHDVDVRVVTLLAAPVKSDLVAVWRESWASFPSWKTGERNDPHRRQS